MADKVTIGIYDSFDGTDDGLINIGPNIKIYKVCNDINDLYSINTKALPEDENITCYVKNVDAVVDEENYRGAFFTYNTDTGGWQEVAVGNHSHVNKYILDRLCTLNDTLLDPNKKYSIRLTKNTDNDEYSIDWVEDKDVLPDLPTTNNSQMYLTSDGESLKWSNNLVPTQSFRKLNYIIDEDTLESSKRVSFKLINTTINISNDELLVFDNGRLIDSPTISVKNNILSISIETDDFELGELITILVIRNGISGFLENVADEYVTKKELISYSYTGELNLNDYVNKTEIREYAKKYHGHSEYATKEHNHDYRYANFHHTHNEYLTRTQVLAIIADAAGADGDIDITGTIQNLVSALTAKIDELINQNYITANTLESEIAATEVKFSNTNNIYYNGEQLTAVIDELKDAKSVDIDEVSSDKIKLDYHNVTRDIGGFTAGDTIYAGMQLDTFIERLIGTDIDNICEPEIKCTVKKKDNNTNYEVGELCTLSVKPEYIQNDGGDLISIKLEVTSATGTVEYDLTNNKVKTISLPLLPFDGTTKAASIKVTAKYDKSTNLDAGELVYKEDIYANRFLFAGSFDFDFTSDYQSQSDYIRQLKEYADSTTNEYKLTLAADRYHRSIVFAVPSSWNKKVEAIVYNEQGCDISDLFDTWTTYVEGDNNSISELYTIYTYKFAEAKMSKMSFNIKLKNSELI